jgi:hypothetical protein
MQQPPPAEGASAAAEPDTDADPGLGWVSEEGESGLEVTVSRASGEASASGSDSGDDSGPSDSSAEGEEQQEGRHVSRSRCSGQLRRTAADIAVAGDTPGLCRNDPLLHLPPAGGRRMYDPSTTARHEYLGGGWHRGTCWLAVFPDCVCATSMTTGWLHRQPCCRCCCCCCCCCCFRC